MARNIIKHIEEQIIRDERNASQLYIECQRSSPEEAIFLRLGFHRVPVRYVQPTTMNDEQFGSGEGPELTLLYKMLGCNYGRVPLTPDDFLSDLRVWLTEVYRLEDPEASQSFRIAASTLHCW